jgi:proteasome lid subunit RPN8/RPN11
MDIQQMKFDDVDWILVAQDRLNDMDLQQMKFDDADWILVAQDRVQHIENIVTNL